MEFLLSKYNFFLILFSLIATLTLAGVTKDLILKFKNYLIKQAAMRQGLKHKKNSLTNSTAEHSNLHHATEVDLTKIALEFWRIKNRIRKLGGISDFHVSGFENSFRKLETTFEAEQVTIVDYTGKPYFDGMNVDVISFEEGGILDQEMVKETLEPGIIYKGRLVKRSKIIVIKKGYIK